MGGERCGGGEGAEGPGGGGGAGGRVGGGSGGGGGGHGPGSSLRPRRSSSMRPRGRALEAGVSGRVACPSPGVRRGRAGGRPPAAKVSWGGRSGWPSWFRSASRIRDNATFYAYAGADLAASTSTRSRRERDTVSSNHAGVRVGPGLTGHSGGGMTGLDLERSRATLAARDERHRFSSACSMWIGIRQATGPGDWWAMPAQPQSSATVPVQPRRLPARHRLTESHHLMTSVRVSAHPTSARSSKRSRSCSVVAEAHLRRGRLRRRACRPAGHTYYAVR